MINNLELKSPHTTPLEVLRWRYHVRVFGCRWTLNLQSDLEEIKRWALRNDMKLNGKKCREMTISFLSQQLDCPPVCIDGLPLDSVSSYKVLGVTFNNQLKWNDNVNVMVKKACKRLYSLRVICSNGDLLTWRPFWLPCDLLCNWKMNSWICLSRLAYQFIKVFVGQDWISSEESFRLDLSGKFLYGRPPDCPVLSSWQSTPKT